MSRVYVVFTWYRLRFWGLSRASYFYEPKASRKIHIAT
jgi:hypothetical protein